MPAYTKDDYLKGQEPFEWLYALKDNEFALAQAVEMIRAQAGSVGVRNFMQLWKAYLSSVQAAKSVTCDNTTDFLGQPMELNCGEWIADDYGVHGVDRRYGNETEACNHPIMPIRRLVNVDDDTEKLVLAYKKRGGYWRTVTVEKKVLASTTGIIALAEYGIAVNSENARNLIKYLADVENLNLEIIPEIKSITRLGWIDGYGFSPYSDELVFDGDVSFKNFYASVQSKGDFSVWRSAVNKVREENIITRIYIAASFASVLVKEFSGLPFFVHLWGGTESCKTVALMAAASVWANPSMGEYIHTFNSTAVGHEVSATFVNNMPLMIDELQILGERKKFDDLIYTLSEGVGKKRGNTNAGLRKVGTWQNCILTTGEMPITNSNSGGGAVNRIIEIDCKDQKLIADPIPFLQEIRSNYGHAGKIFVENLQTEDGIKLARDIQKINYLKLTSDGDITDKQALSASLILTADALANEWIFGGKGILTAADIKPFLSTKRSVSVNLRALEYIYDYVNINNNRFDTKDNTGEIWGTVDDEHIYIIKAQFDKIMQAEGYNPTAFLSWAKSNNVVDTEYGRMTKKKRIGDSSARCVCLFKDKSEISLSPQPNDGLPF